MTTPATAAQLLNRTRSARAAWEAAVARVGNDRLTEPLTDGVWATRDVIAHLTADCRWMTGQLRAIMRGDLPTVEECLGHEHAPPPDVDLSDQDQRNAWRHETIDRHRSLDEVLANAPQWADALEEAIAALPDSELGRPYTFAEHLHIAHIRPAVDGEPSWLLERIVASYADEHYASHTADLHAWLSRLDERCPDRATG
jgi:hypothetical protein